MSRPIASLLAELAVLAEADRRIEAGVYDLSRIDVANQPDQWPEPELLRNDGAPALTARPSADQAPDPRITGTVKALAIGTRITGRATWKVDPVAPDAHQKPKTGPRSRVQPNCAPRNPGEPARPAEGAFQDSSPPRRQK